MTRTPRTHRSAPAATRARLPEDPPVEGPVPARAALAITAALAATLVAIAIAGHRVGDYFTETDFYGGYGPGARLVAAGAADPARYGVTGPLFDGLLAAVGFVTRDLFVAGEVIAIASVAVALAAWFALLRARAGGATAAWSVAFLAANATLVRYGYSATTDAPALALQAVALWCALGARWRGAAFAAGACAALAAITRYTAIALLPALLVAAVLAPRGTRVRRALGLLAGFAVIAAPVLAWFVRAGHFPGEALFHDVAYEAYALGSGRTLADYQAGLQPGLHSLAQALAHDPAALVRRELANTLGHVRADARDLLGWPVAALCAVGAVAIALERGRRRWVTLAIAAVALYLALVPAASSARYSLALAPFYLALAGAAAGSARLARLARVGPVALVHVLALAALALALRENVRAQRDTLALLPVEVRGAAAALRREAGDGARVTALKPHVAWYANAVPVPFPNVATLDALAAECQRSGARWIYYSWIEAANRPALWYLLDPQARVPGLRVVATTAHHASVLYAVEPGLGAEPSWLASDTARAASEARVVAAMPAGTAWRARLSLALWARGTGRWAEARENAGAALAGHADLALAHRIVGEADMRMNDVPGARAAYERAVSLEPANVDARVALGWLRLSTGDEAGAAEAWRPTIDQVQHRPTLERMQAVFAARGDATAEARARAALARTAR